jgi:ArsR family transcriptional regulator
MSALGLKQATVSHHLKLLKLGALVDFEKRGVWSFWSVRRGGLSALKQRLSAALESLA